MANYLEDLSGVLQGFGAAGIALLVVPVLITLLARDVPRALYTSLLSLASFMLLERIPFTFEHSLHAGRGSCILVG